MEQTTQSKEEQEAKDIASIDLFLAGFKKFQREQEDRAFMLMPEVAAKTIGPGLKADPAQFDKAVDITGEAFKAAVRQGVPAGQMIFIVHAIGAALFETFMQK